MGQVAVGQPYPQEKPVSAAQVPSADDLLAQLAGDEIDRLLAESDSGGAAPDVAAPAPEPVAAAAVEPAPVEPAPAPPAVEAPALITGRVTAAEEIAKELDEAQSPSVIKADPHDAATQLAMQSPQLPKFADPIPFYLKPLAWLSSPLDYCPEEFRELAGKVAIVTMVNAIAVLGYVIMFRRHH
jgi:hypothetical protein